MAQVTGSSLPLLRSCQWWARADVIAPPAAPQTPSMALGTAVHGAIEAALSGEDMHVSEDAMEYVRAWITWWQTAPIGRGPWRPEQAYAYRPTTDTARHASVRSRDYANFASDEIAGTVDAVAIEDGMATVVDWKTGADFQHMTADARDNWQLRFYGLAVARAHNVHTVRIVIARITPDGVRTTEYVLDALELDEVADTIKALVASVPTAQPTPGVHCGRCKVVAICPTTVSAEDALVAAQPQTALVISSPEQASALLQRLWQVQAACETVERMLKEYAANRNDDGIPLPNGKRWVRKTVDRESFNFTGENGAEGLSEILSLGAESAIETKTTATKTGIEKALRASGLTTKEMKAKVEDLYGKLRVLGVLRNNEVDSYKEVG